MTEIHTFNGKQVLLEVVPRTAGAFFLEANQTFPDNARLMGFNPAESSNGETLKYIQHAFDKLSLIGTAHWENGAIVFSFDPEPFVEYIARYDCYMAYSGNDECHTAKDSFESLLLSIGRYWVNPLGETHGAGGFSTRYLKEKRIKEWQEAESRKLSVEDMIVFILIDKV